MIKRKKTLECLKIDISDLISATHLSRVQICIYVLKHAIFVILYFDIKYFKN